MSAVIFIVGWCPNEAAYQDFMFTNPKGWSIKSKFMDQLPKETPKLITRWDHNVAKEIQDSFPNQDLIICGFSFGGSKAVEVCKTLGRPVKKLILIDPVNHLNGNVKNTTGFSISSNIVEAECYYRIATSMPWSSYISNVLVPPNSFSTTKIQNFIYTPKSKDPWAAHGEYVWSGVALNSIKKSL